ncbi:MAG TPA: DMT family transporter [Rhabdochlamydiaceae bacterium]|nr:DMT family transporter [Rhabdochlamydiaceae bacterium]
MSEFKKGAFYILLAWFFFTLVITLSRFTSRESSVAIVLFSQNLISLLFMLPFMLKEGKGAFASSKFKVILLRGAAGYLSFAFAFFAVQYTSLVNTVLLSNASPLFIPLIIFAWRGIHIGYKLWIGIITGFIGIGFILKPDIHLLTNLGAILALSSALCFAISMICMRRLIKTEPVHTILFYHFLIGTLISLPFAIYTWNFPTCTVLLQLILIGILSFIGQYFILSAFRFGKPSALSPFTYSSVVYATILQWFIFKTFPDLLSIIGIIFICAGSIVCIIYAESAEKKIR